MPEKNGNGEIAQLARSNRIALSTAIMVVIFQLMGWTFCAGLIWSEVKSMREALRDQTIALNEHTKQQATVEYTKADALRDFAIRDQLRDKLDARILRLENAVLPTGSGRSSLLPDRGRLSMLSPY